MSTILNLIVFLVLAYFIYYAYYTYYVEESVKIYDIQKSIGSLITKNDLSLNSNTLKKLKESTTESKKKISDILSISTNDTRMNSKKKISDILSISTNDTRMNSNWLKDLKESASESIKKMNETLIINGNSIGLNSIGLNSIGLNSIGLNSIGLNNISNDIKNISKKYDEYLISNDSYTKNIDNRLMLSEDSVRGNKEELNNISNDLKNVIAKYEDYVFSNNNYTQKLNDRVESYINQNYLAIKNINDSIDIIKYGMGDIIFSIGVNTCNCPTNSYVCGINYNVPMSTITSINPQCCSFNF